MTTVPLISLLMPVYNAERTLTAALESIWSQRLSDFEVIVVNDGSSDESLRILEACADPRLRVISCDVNGGVTNALNLALNNAAGQFVARFDADDVSYTDRLSVQIAALRDDESLGVIGSALSLVDDSGRVSGMWSYPETAILARWQTLFKTPVAHSAVMYRRKLVAECGGYRNDFPLAEDYELWSRVGRRAGIRSLSRPLVRYSVGSGGVSRKRQQEQAAMQVQIAGRNMSDLLQEEVSPGLVRVLSVEVDRVGDMQISLEQLEAAVGLMKRLFVAFVRREQAGVNPRVIENCATRLTQLVKLLPVDKRLAAVRLARRNAPVGVYGVGAQLRSLLPSR